MHESELLPLIGLGILSMTMLALGFIAFFNFSQRKLIQEKIKIKDQEIRHQEALLHNNILTQENERQRIAKDLHDDIGSKLSVIHLNLFQLNNHGDGSDKFQQSMELIRELVHKTINSTRSISHNLLPPTLEDFGLAVALEALCESFNKTNEVLITFDGNLKKTPSENQADSLQIFRVVQELINNSIRHGKATRISLNLLNTNDGMELHYEDDGQGMAPEQLSEKKGMGMKNIDSRLKMIGASITYQSAPGQGLKAKVLFHHLKKQTV